MAFLELTQCILRMMGMHPVIESCALRDRAEFVSKREHTRLIDKSAHILTNKPTVFKMNDRDVKSDLHLRCGRRAPPERRPRVENFVV